MHVLHRLQWLALFLRLPSLAVSASSRLAVRPQRTRQSMMVVEGFGDGVESFDGTPRRPKRLRRQRGHRRHRPGTEGLLYDHMPKAGGTYLIHLLRSALRHDSFVVRREFANLTQQDADKYFVVGSVRNPCDYYLSLWSYGAEHGGAMIMHMTKEDQALYHTTSANKSSAEDIERFRNWVKVVNHKHFPGIMSVRFARSYASMDREIHASSPPKALERAELKAVQRALEKPDFMDRVQCWIKAEDMNAGAANCLKKWHRRSGIEPDWPAMKEAVAAGNKFATSHGKCRTYFTPELESLVRKHERAIFKYFDYKTCCN